MARLYRLLLFAYPPALRRDHGDEMTAAFVAQWAAARSGAARMRLVARLLRDFVTSLAREWRRHRGAHGAHHVHQPPSRSTPMLGLMADARQAARLFRAAPGLALGAVLTIGLGIGATAAIVGLADATLLRPLAIDAPDRVVQAEFSWSWPDFRDLESGTSSYTHVAGWTGLTLALDRPEGAVTIAGLGVSGRFFALTGIAPVAGRLIQAADDTPGAPLMAVMSERLWRREFGSARDLVGSTLRVNGQTLTVAGIVPASFRGLSLSETPELFVPLTIVPRISTGFLADPAVTRERGWSWIQVVGRLADGVSMDVARAETEAIFRAGHPPEPGATAEPVEVTPVTARASGLTQGGDLHRFIAVLAGATGITLLLSCATVAGLLLARTEARRRELSVRVALGAGRLRLARLLIVESLAIGLGGTLVAMLTARVLLDWLGSYSLPGNVSIASLDLRVNARLFLVATAAGVVTSIVFGLAPIWRAARLAGSGVLSEGSRGTTRRPLRAWLLGTQVATCVVLVGGSLAFGRAMRDAWGADLGFDVTRSALVAVNAGLVPGAPDVVRARQARMLDAVRAVPGVLAASWSGLRPFRGSMSMTAHPADGGSVPGDARADRDADVDINVVAPDYFRALGMPVLRGRDFDDRDTPGTPPVVIVSQSLVDRYWPGQDGVGRQLRSDRESTDREKAMTIVGVVPDVRRGVERDVRPTVYLRMGQHPAVFGAGGNYIVVQAATGDAAAVGAAAARAISAAESSTPIGWVRTFEDEFSATLMAQRLGLLLFELFAGLAMLVTGLGLYAVFSFAVTQRTREIGLRVALGAPRGGLVRLIAWQAAMPLAGGVLVGAAVFWLAGQGLERFLFGAPAADPARLAALAGVMAVLAAFATWVPARRALAIAPIAALRDE